MGPSTQFCPKCRARVTAHKGFCPNCGAAMLPPPPPARSAVIPARTIGPKGAAGLPWQSRDLPLVGPIVPLIISVVFGIIVSQILPYIWGGLTSGSLGDAGNSMGMTTVTFLMSFLSAFVLRRRKR